MIEFLIEVDGKIFEISELVKSVSYTDKLNDGCSKLDFTFRDDDLKISNGSAVRFKFDGVGVFSGIIFKHGQNKKKEISATAYDMLRYCKAKDIIVVKDETVTKLAERMCNYFNLRKGALVNTQYVLKTRVHDGKTWLDILYAGISDTLTNKGKWYSLRDEFGAVALRDLEGLKLDLVLGDESLCYDFSYDVSIDDNFYNQIKIYVKNKEASLPGTFADAKDDESIKKLGLLQYYESVDHNTNYSQAKAKAEMLLSLYNREVETLTLTCLGDIRVRAGNSFYASIEDIQLNKRLIVKSVTHDFLPVHTMTVEVAI